MKKGPESNSRAMSPDEYRQHVDDDAAKFEAHRGLHDLSKDELLDQLSILLKKQEEDPENTEITEKIRVVKDVLGTAAELDKAQRSADARHEEGAFEASEQAEEEKKAREADEETPTANRQTEQMLERITALAEKGEIEARQEVLELIDTIAMDLAREYNRIFSYAGTHPEIHPRLRKKAEHDAETIERELAQRLEGLLGVPFPSALRIQDWIGKYDGPPEKLAEAAKSIGAAEQRMRGVLESLESM